MANLKITFYKDYPITPESEYAPYFDTLVETGESIYAALQDFKKVEYNTVGDFTPLQDYINVQSFAEVDGCNYVRVEVVGEYTEYYYIKDIIALSEIQREGRYYRPAQVFLYEDVFLSDYYQVTPTGALNKPLVSGNVVQCNQYDQLTANIQTAPISGVFNKMDIAPARQTYYNKFVLLATYADSENRIAHIVCRGTGDNGLTLADLSTYANIFSGLSSIRTTIELGGTQKTTTENVSLLNLYILPYDWVSTWFYDFTKIIKSIIAIGIHDTEVDVTYLTGMDFETFGEGAPRLVATLTPEIYRRAGFKDLDKFYLKTANNFINIPWKGGTPSETNAPTVKIFIEIPDVGTDSDTITITAGIGGNIYDISNDFKLDVAVNQIALNMSQHKVSTALNTLTGVVGAASGVAGGIASGNYFGAVSAAVGGVKSITGLIEGVETPAKMTIQGNASAALDLYGLITILKVSPDNYDVISAEIYRHGYIYPERPFLSVSHLINNDTFIKLENAVINGSFGVDISRELKERFERGIKFIRLEDI